MGLLTHCWLGKKALWEHNVYGLTPTIGSANHLLQYAKEHRDAALMQEVMKLLKKNNLPLQPSTADIVFSICNDTDQWGCSQSIRRDLSRVA
ncbi:hypothetical protein EUGRSUZ_F02603 [Eucalyptus grandis]|uniref:Uncharacterized protein n=2 Tax=Eucalyptus grandis TaxID=71139 RepID=A0ACC3KIG6_EUCGR|nr:hypothetical protein EUGRSUZ_F02603 [Eucalyptus grandis]